MTSLSFSFQILYYYNGPNWTGAARLGLVPRAAGSLGSAHSVTAASRKVNFVPRLMASGDADGWDGRWAELGSARQRRAKMWFRPVGHGERIATGLYCVRACERACRRGRALFGAIKCVCVCVCVPGIRRMGMGMGWAARWPCWLNPCLASCCYSRACAWKRENAC